MTPAFLQRYDKHGEATKRFVQEHQKPRRKQPNKLSSRTSQHMRKNKNTNVSLTECLVSLKHRTNEIKRISLAILALKQQKFKKYFSLKVTQQISMLDRVRSIPMIVSSMVKDTLNCDYTF